MVDVAQQVRALDCGSRGRRFESGLPPKGVMPMTPFFLSDSSRMIDPFQFSPKFVNLRYIRNFQFP